MPFVQNLLGDAAAQAYHEMSSLLMCEGTRAFARRLRKASWACLRADEEGGCSRDGPGWDAVRFGLRVVGGRGGRCWKHSWICVVYLYITAHSSTSHHIVSHHIILPTYLPTHPPTYLPTHARLLACMQRYLFMVVGPNADPVFTVDHLRKVSLLKPRDPIKLGKPSPKSF